MIWNEGQRHTMNEFQKWYRFLPKQTFQYAGAAGTGKTTISPPMIHNAGLDLEKHVLAMALSGRAASNLTRKGIPATSIHSGIMDVVQEVKRDEYGNPIVINGRVMHSLRFKKKPNLPKGIKLLLFDEGTFVDEPLAKMAESFGLPILVMGDIEQLGPPFGRPYYLHNPDCVLTEITRQAEGSGIIELATLIREGKELPKVRTQYGNNAFIIPKHEITDGILKELHMITTVRNNTRNYFNKRIREDILGITSQYPVKGDKLICRKNYWTTLLGDIPLTNGTLGYVQSEVQKENVSINGQTILIDFRPEFSEYDYLEDLRLSIPFFREPCGQHDMRQASYNPGYQMELGHAMTTYLSQGSEFPSNMMWDEPVGTFKTTKQHRYTGITRAKDAAILAI